MRKFEPITPLFKDFIKILHFSNKLESSFRPKTARFEQYKTLISNLKMNINGHQWLLVDTSGHLWDICGHQWTLVDTSGHWWTLVDISGPQWDISGHQWDISGHQWTLVDICGHLRTFVNISSFLTVIILKVATRTTTNTLLGPRSLRCSRSKTYSSPIFLDVIVE